MYQLLLVLLVGLLECRCPLLDALCVWFDGRGSDGTDLLYLHIRQLVDWIDTGHIHRDDLLLIIVRVPQALPILVLALELGPRQVVLGEGRPRFECVLL